MISLFGKNEPESTLLEKLKASVSKTKAVLSETVDTIFLGERKIDPSLLKQLETFGRPAKSSTLYAKKWTATRWPMPLS
jgi:IS4 transposase